MTPVVITNDAESDLEAIADYIAIDSPRRATSFTAELIEKARNIGYMPRAYPSRPDIGLNVRVAIHREYVIFFRVRREFVEILRIVHGARDLRGLFEE